MALEVQNVFGKDNNDNGFVLCARFFDDWTLIAINYKEIITLFSWGGFLARN